MTEKADRLEKLMAEMLGIYKAKNADYGDSFADSFREFGITSAVVRMTDKMNRIKSLAKKGDRQVQDESLRDSLMDLANYALMTVVELENELIEDTEECGQDLDLEPILDHEISINVNEPACDISSVIEELEKQFKELAPVEGREKEEKFYLKHRWIFNKDFYMYLQKTSYDDKKMSVRVLGFSDSDNDDIKFSEKEIEDIKKKFNTDLADFELVEVEE